MALDSHHALGSFSHRAMSDSPFRGMNSISLRLMATDDVPGADELRRLAGWNQTSEDWRRWLGLEPDGCFVALDGGRVVGTVTTITYGTGLAWIGMMLVHPDQRRCGIGTRLMRHALSHLRGKGISTVKLDATPAGTPVYEKLGFVQEWTLTRWQREAQPRVAAPARHPSGTREFSESDWGSVEAIDSAAFGVSRSRLIRALAQTSKSLLVWPETGSPAGWGLLRSGAVADYLGPIASDQPACLGPLATALLACAATRSVVWDIPDPNKPAAHLARNLGFSHVRQLTRMRLGSGAAAGNPQTQFAIADPAVG